MQKRITLLYGSDGQVIKDEELIKEEIISFYQNLLGTVDKECTGGGEVGQLKGILQNKLVVSSRDFLTATVTKEVYNTIKHMPTNKSHGPDGFTADFFKSSWDIIGELVTAVVQEFFTTGQILKELNASVISLISKCQNPTKVSEFRPISFCNISVSPRFLLIG